MNGTIFVTMMALFIPTPLLFAREAQTAAPEEMKAIVLHEYGGPAVLRYEDAPRPEPKDGGDTLTRSYGVVKKGGTIVTIAGEPDQAVLDAYGIRGSISSAPKGETFAELTRLIEDKKLTPIVTQVFPLSEVAKAQDQIATRHTRGKIVLRVAPDPKS